jgi:NAD(P)-dependent dehydrogenase (short-subunit alcohol dehydrogenase family)
LADRSALGRKVVLITGATSGVGRETARSLAGMGAHLILACRDRGKAEAARDEILRQVTGANLAAESPKSPRLDLLDLDLASLASVRACAGAVLEDYSRLDVLINNAGTFSMKRRETADGLELTMAVDYFGPVLLTMLLLPLIRQTPGARIVNVSSAASAYGSLNLGDLNLRRGFNGFRAYASSKQAMNLFTLELAERLRGDGVTVNCLHPGHAATGIWPKDVWYLALANRLMRRFQVTPEEGARTSVYLAASPEAAGITGQYFVRERRADLGRNHAGAARQKELWNITMDLLGLPFGSSLRLLPPIETAGNKKERDQGEDPQDGHIPP